MGAPLISVIIPALNEEVTIGSILARVQRTAQSNSLCCEIIVVDDGSIDNTKAIAANHNAIVLFNKENQGKGYSMRKALRRAKGDIIVTIDSDGSHRPEEIPILVKPLFTGADIVVGSRFLGNGTAWTSRLNLIGNYVLNAVVMLLTGKRLTDSQTGFRAFKRDVLRQITLESDGFEIESEMTVKALKGDLVLQEVPICCQARGNGISRLKTFSDGLKILTVILRASLQ